VAEKKLSRSGVSLVRADALSPPFDGAFDLVTCFSALGHFLPDEQRRLVRAARRCLGAGGRFVFATGRMPPLWSRGYCFSRLFNAAMDVRNAVWSPPFVMYYLTFLLPEAESTLSGEGFDVEVLDGLFAPPFERFVLVDARLRR
jgi:SAM-dependent methyltransferase